MAQKVAPALLELSSQFSQGTSKLQLNQAANVDAPIGGLLHEEVITVSPASAFSDVDLTAFGPWNSLRIEMTVVNDDSVTRSVSIFVNDSGDPTDSGDVGWDTTNSNYDNENLSQVATTVTGARNNTATIAQVVSGGRSLLTGILTFDSGFSSKNVLGHFSSCHMDGTREQEHRAWRREPQTTALNGLRFSFGGTTVLGVGSKLRIYRG